MGLGPRRVGVSFLVLRLELAVVSKNCQRKRSCWGENTDPVAHGWGAGRVARPSPGERKVGELRVATHRGYLPRGKKFEKTQTKGESTRGQAEAGVVSTQCRAVSGHSTEFSVPFGGSGTAFEKELSFSFFRQSFCGINLAPEIW